MKNYIIILAVCMLFISGCLETSLTGSEEKDLTNNQQEPSAPEPITPELSPLITLNFYGGGPLSITDLNVYNNGRFLGVAKEGYLEVGRDLLKQGDIKIEGVVFGSEFELSYELGANELDSDILRWPIRAENLEEYMQDLSKTNTQEISEDLFNEIAKTMAIEKLFPLTLREEFNSIALKMSQNMASGKNSSAHDLLQKNKIFYMTTETTNYILEHEAPDSDFAEDVVSTWLESPADRAIVLNGGFTDAGVGVYCEKTSCYVTALFVRLIDTHSDFLDPEYAIIYPLYDNTYEFDYDTNVLITFESNRPLNAFVIKNTDYWDLYLRGGKVAKTYTFAATTEGEKKLQIKKNWALIIESREEANYRSKVTDFNLILDYSIQFE